MTDLRSWYHPVECANTVEDPLVVNRCDLGRYDEWDFMRGKRIRDWDRSIWFASSDRQHDGEPDDVLQNHLGLLIFSAGLRHSLERARVRDLQYLPIQVRLSDGQAIPGYAIVNILPLIPALDTARTDLDVFPEDYFLPERRGLIRAIRRPVLVGAAVQNYDIFRLAEYHVMYFVSERFKVAFENGNFTGLAFGNPVPIT
jgi:hypothetical protein